MKTKYKWIKFKEILNPKRKTSVWECKNFSDELLGEIRWLTGWRQYIFEAEAWIVMNHQCLKDVADFLDQLNLNQKIHNVVDSIAEMIPDNKTLEHPVATKKILVFNKIRTLLPEE